MSLLQPGPAPFVHREQLPLPGLGPMEGERYRNRATGTLATVVRVDQRRYGWVTVRIRGGEQTLRLDSFLAHFLRI